MIRVFISYSHADEALRQELDKHLMSLKRQGLVEVWNDRRIGAGEEWAKAIDANIESSHLILFLVSSDFIASPYCYDVELAEAMRRHEGGDAIVVPIILRPCDWQNLPFGKLQAATRDGRPIVKFPTLDDGFLEVVHSIKAAAERISAQSRSGETESRKAATPARSGSAAMSGIDRSSGRRSSNLHVKKTFSDHDRDTFRVEAFEYISDFFENSLFELEQRNPHLKAHFRRRDANSFEAATYENGKQATRCGIWIGGRHFGGDIAYSNAGLGNGNSFNESIGVADDGQVLGLKPLGMAMHFAGERSELLTLEGAAEYFWSIFVRPLQD